jgi:ATP-dependent DNA helicase RecQ
MIANNSEKTSWDAVLAEFKRIWGYDSFRSPQGEIVRSLLDQQDALIVLPTGVNNSLLSKIFIVNNNKL